jgi:hypothetical protein
MLLRPITSLLHTRRLEMIIFSETIGLELELMGGHSFMFVIEWI